MASEEAQRDREEKQRRMDAALENLDLPENPVTDLEQAAIAYRTVFLAFSAQDFPAGQALYLTSCFMLNTPGSPPR